MEIIALKPNLEYPACARKHEFDCVKKRVQRWHSALLEKALTIQSCDILFLSMKVVGASRVWLYEVQFSFFCHDVNEENFIRDYYQMLNVYRKPHIRDVLLLQ